jgi:prepilin-type N-terminal cleavage/methylation domain-containing protein
MRGLMEITKMISATGKKNGFTLIELLVAIAIVATLMGMMLSGLMSTSVTVKRASSLAMCQSVRDAILAYQADCGELPWDDAPARGNNTGRWVYQLQRMGKAPPYINGLERDDITVNDAAQTGKIYDKFGGVLKFRAPVVGNLLADYRRNLAKLDYPFFVWSPGADGMDEFTTLFVLYETYGAGPADGWGINADNWKTVVRLKDPDQWCQNQGGDDPIAGN